MRASKRTQIVRHFTTRSPYLPASRRKVKSPTRSSQMASNFDTGRIVSVVISAAVNAEGDLIMQYQGARSDELVVREERRSSGLKDF
jgi:hypothetical protein